MILSIDPELDMAWHLKERFIVFNATASYETAPKLLEDLIRDFVLANIPEFSKFTGAINNWRKEIVNSFLMYKGRRVNNGVAESLNATISTLLFNTRGIRNVERRRKRIMYAINKTGFMIK
jgi:transposase